MKTSNRVLSVAVENKLP